MLYALWYVGLVALAGWLFHFLRDAAPELVATPAIALTGLAVLVLVVIGKAVEQLAADLRLRKIKRLERIQ